MVDISVVVPMYNAHSTIIRALKSIYDQTYQGIFEIIVVNDGSTDDSLEVVNNYIKMNQINNIKVINKKNGGVSSARNAGLKVARGKYIAFLDSDDEWLHNKIETQIDIFNKNNDITLLGSNIFDKKLNRFFFKKFNYITVITINNLIFKNFFQPSTVLFRRDLIDEIGFFPEDQRYAEEGNFFFKAAVNAKCFLINEKLVNYGFNKSGFGEKGLSGNIVEMQKGEIRNLKFAYREGYIDFLIYCIAVVFSYIKYFRRIVIVELRKYR